MENLLVDGFLAQEVLWGIDLWRPLVALLIIFASFAARPLVKALFGSLLKKRVERTRVQWDDDAVAYLPAPLALLLQVLLWHLAAVVLLLPEEPVDLRRFIFNGLEVALAVALTWIAFKLLDVLAGIFDRMTGRTESRLDDQLVPLLRKTLKVFIAVVVAVMVLQNLGYSVTSLIASLGIGGLALALAAKDTVANFFGSIVVFTDQPFHVGDWVEFGEVEGVVEEVGMRTTRIRRFDKSLASVPNQTFTQKTLINHSVRPIRRLKVTVGLSYETTPSEMRAFLARVRGLLAERETFEQESWVVHFTGFNDSSLDVLVQAYTVTTVWTEFLEAQEELLLAIMNVVEELGLEIAFPTRTVHLRAEQTAAPSA